MSNFHPATDAALQQPVVMAVGLVEIVFPDYTLRLCDGPGEIVWNGNTFYGSDPTYGSISSIESLTDGTGDMIPALSLTIAPASDTAAANLARADMQGSIATFMFAVVNAETGTIIGEPLTLFAGEVDIPVMRFRRGSYEIEYQIVSAIARAMNRYDGARLAPNYHRSIWPNEAGLDQITGIRQFVYWGREKTSGVSRVGTSSGGVGAGRGGKAPNMH